MKYSSQQTHRNIADAIPDGRQSLQTVFSRCYTTRYLLVGASERVLSVIHSKICTGLTGTHHMYTSQYITWHYSKHTQNPYPATRTYLQLYSWGCGADPAVCPIGTNRFFLWGKVIRVWRWPLKFYHYLALKLLNMSLEWKLIHISTCFIFIVHRSSGTYF